MAGDGLGCAGRRVALGNGAFTVDQKLGEVPLDSLTAEQAGRRWWKFSGAVYMLRAVKRVPGMRLITPCWQKKTLRNKALQPVVRKTPKEIHGQ